MTNKELAIEMRRIYGKAVKETKIRLRHRRVVRKYIMEIERAHEKAANSTLHFDKEEKPLISKGCAETLAP